MTDILVGALFISLGLAILIRHAARRPGITGRNAAVKRMLENK